MRYTKCASHPLGDADRLSSVQSPLPRKRLVTVSNGDHELRIISTPSLFPQYSGAWGRETHPNEE